MITFQINLIPKATLSYIADEILLNKEISVENLLEEGKLKLDEQSRDNI